MIIRKIDGTEYCDLCQRTCDSGCKECVSYQHPMFTHDEKTHTTWYHGENGEENRRINNDKS